MSIVRIICLRIRMYSRDKNHGVILFQKLLDTEDTGAEKGITLSLFLNEIYHRRHFSKIYILWYNL